MTFSYIWCLFPIHLITKCQIHKIHPSLGIIYILFRIGFLIYLLNILLNQKLSVKKQLLGAFPKRKFDQADHQ